MGNAIEAVQRYFGNHFPGIDSLRRESLSLHLNGDVDAREGSATDGVVIGAYTLQAVGYGYQDDGGSFTDDTTDLNDAGTDDVAVFPTAEAQNDAFYFGDAAKFSGLKIVLGTAGSSAGVVAWEYYDGAAWTSLATAHKLQDDTDSFNATAGTYFVTFVQPTDWTKTTINSTEAYWVRARCTTVYDTTNPLITQAYLLATDTGVGVNFPANGIVTGASWTADTASGATTDTVIQIVNLTKATATTVTLTKATKAGYNDVAATNGLAFEKGDTLLLQCVQGDSSEVADVNLVIEFKA